MPQGLGCKGCQGRFAPRSGFTLDSRCSPGRLLGKRSMRSCIFLRFQSLGHRHVFKLAPMGATLVVAPLPADAMDGLTWPLSRLDAFYHPVRPHVGRTGRPQGRLYRLGLCLKRAARAKKTKQGQRPALDFSSFIPVASELFFFLEWLRLVAPPVFPPSDLDHTRPTDCNVTLMSPCWPP